MDPVAWGPPLWSLLHAAARSATRVPSVHAALQAMHSTLPCCKCRSSLRSFYRAITSLPLDSDFALTWMLHNAVNRKLGKAELTLARAERRWATATAPVCPLALLDAMLIVAHNYGGCRRKDKRQQYAALWAAVADMCDAVCSVRHLAPELRLAGAQPGGAKLAAATNDVRTAELGRRGCAAAAFTAQEARRHYSAARGRRARPLARRRRR